MTLSTKI